MYLTPKIFQLPAKEKCKSNIFVIVIFWGFLNDFSLRNIQNKEKIKSNSKDNERERKKNYYFTANI